MMKKNKVYITVLAIFILAGLAGVLDYPLPFKIPYLPQIPFKLGLDLQGGTHLIYEADLTNIADAEKEVSMQGLRDVIERRVNLFGAREPVVQVQKERLIVELAGVTDPALAIKMIGQTPFLEFRESKGEGDQATFEVTPLTGKYLKKAEVGFDQTGFQPLVSLEFNDEGAEIFKDLTTRNIGKPLAIFIDGVAISAPTVQEAIAGGKAQITGKFTIEEAKALARNLNAGALPVPIQLISQQNVGPTLGAISLQQSLKAGIIGFIGMLLFLIFFYRLPGFLASLALSIYVILVLALFKLIPVTLTLAGIGGFILSIGMAVDANILIFSRIKEELSAGARFAAAVEEGFRRAWPAIRDGNITTLIVAAILFGFGTSFVKGFALALSVGIIISMFSAIFITKNFLRVFAGTKLEKIKILWH